MAPMFEPRAESTVRSAIAGIRTSRSVVKQKYGDNKRKYKKGEGGYRSQRIVTSPTRDMLGNRQYVQQQGGKSGKGGGVQRRESIRERDVRVRPSDKGTGGRSR